MTDDDDTTTGRRPRDPAYDVFEVQDLARTGVSTGASVPPVSGTPVRALVLIAEDVHAPDRRAAIVKATEGRSDDEKFGQFATVRAGELKMAERKKRVIEQDDWSDPAETGPAA